MLIGLLVFYSSSIWLWFLRKIFHILSQKSLWTPTVLQVFLKGLLDIRRCHDTGQADRQTHRAERHDDRKTWHRRLSLTPNFSTLELSGQEKNSHTINDCTVSGDTRLAHSKFWRHAVCTNHWRRAPGLSFRETQGLISPPCFWREKCLDMEVL